MQHVTTEMLIQFHYNELCPKQNNLIEAEIINSWTLREKYSVIKASAARLNKYKTESNLRPQAITNLLNYAQAHAKAV